MAIETGQTAEADDVNDAFNARPKYAQGSYTGNDGSGRQITTGFKCALVIILANSIGTLRGQHILVQNKTLHIDTDTSLADDTANCYIHASDGFVVDLTGGSNSGSQVYYYFALSE